MIALLLTSLGLLGCAKEEPEPLLLSDNSSTTQRFNPEQTEDCQCFMRVLGVENPPMEDPWGIFDWTYGFASGGYELSGVEFLWFTGQQPPLFYQFPSPFAELHPTLPSNGLREITLGTGNTVPNPDFAVHTEVKCTSGDIEDNLVTRTYLYTFRFGDGQPKPIGTQVSFQVEFDCYRAQGCCGTE